MLFFDRLGTTKKKYRVQFVLERIETNINNLSGNISIQIKRGSHKQQTQPMTFDGDLIQFGKQRLVFDPVTMFYDTNKKEFLQKTGQIRVIIQKKGEKKVGGVIQFDLAEFVNKQKTDDGTRIYIKKQSQRFTSKSSKAKFELTYEIYLKFIRDSNSDAQSDAETFVSSNALKKKKKQQQQQNSSNIKQEKKKKHKDREQFKSSKKDQLKLTQKQRQNSKQNKKKKYKQQQQQKQHQKEKKDKKIKDKRSKNDQQQQGNLSKERQKSRNQDKKDEKKKKKKYQSDQQQISATSIRKLKQQQNDKEQKEQPIHKDNYISDQQQQIIKVNKAKKRKPTPAQFHQSIKVQQQPIINQQNKKIKKQQKLGFDDIFNNMIEAKKQTPIKLEKTEKVKKVEKFSDKIIPSIQEPQESIVQQYYKKQSDRKVFKNNKLQKQQSLSFKQSYLQQQISKLQKLKKELITRNLDLKDKQKQLQNQIRQSQQIQNIPDIRATTFNTVQQYNKTIKQLQSKSNQLDKQNSSDLFKYEDLKHKYDQLNNSKQVEKIQAKNEIKQKQREQEQQMTSLKNNLKQLKQKQTKYLKDLQNLRKQRDQLNSNIEKINASSDIIRQRNAQQLLNQQKKKIINALNAAASEGNAQWVEFIETNLPTY